MLGTCAVSETAGMRTRYQSPAFRGVTAACAIATLLAIHPAPMATHMASGTRSEGWTLTGMDAEGRRLFITYAIGDPCSESAGVLVEESAKTVTLTATTRVVRGGSNCASSLRTAEGYVDLKHPLGTRKLLHASAQRTPDWP